MGNVCGVGVFVILSYCPEQNIRLAGKLCALPVRARSKSEPLSLQVRKPVFSQRSGQGIIGRHDNG